MRVNESLIKEVSLGIIIHTVIIWAALALGYNSYKEVMREIDPLTRAVRDSIQGIFPWAIAGFSALYLIPSIRKKGSGIFLSYNQYVYITIFYAALLNFFCFAKGKDILIPLNLSIPYLAVLLFLVLFLIPYLNLNLSKTKINAQDWLPPVIYRYIKDNQSKSQDCNKEISSTPFIISFMASMTICAILLIFKAEKSAEQLSVVAAFMIVIGIGIEIYKLITMRNSSKNNDD